MKRIGEIMDKVYNDPELRGSVVPLFIGDPGLGKTKMIEVFAEKQGAKLVELITSQMSPFEISGIAMPDKDTKKMTYYNFDKLEDLKDGDILFFDELLNGNPIVLNACLTILEQRRFISGRPLPNIMIVAAANPQGMVPLTPQIKERFVWYDVKFDKKMWVDYMVKKRNVTRKIGNKLAAYIEEEKFTTNNFYSPRSVDKAVSMMIRDVPTPYQENLLPVLSEPITNKLEEKVILKKAIRKTKNRKGSPEISLAPGEMTTWLKAMKLKNNSDGITEK